MISTSAFYRHAKTPVAPQENKQKKETEVVFFKSKHKILTYIRPYRNVTFGAV